jgi:hypothetical protein
MKTRILQLEPEDDLLTTREKIAWSQSSRVILVWPRAGLPLLENSVVLAQLRQAARSTGVEIAIVATARPVIEQAQELGIPVFESIIAAKDCDPWPKQPHISEKRSGSRATAAYLRQQQVFFKPLLEVDERKMPTRVVSVLSAAALLAALLLFIPSAQVSMAMETQQQNVSIEVCASPNVNEPSVTGMVPAEVLTWVVSGEDDLDSTGQVILADQYAAGQVLVYNLSGEAIELPAGLVVRTSSAEPVRFETLDPLLLSPGPTLAGVEARIRALWPGASGNVDSGAIQLAEGDVGLNLRVENQQPTGGGGERSVPAPTQADFDTLRQRLLDRLQHEALNQLKTAAEPGQSILTPSLGLRSVLYEQQQPALGQPGDRVKYLLQLEFTAWSVKNTDIEKAAVLALDAVLPEGYAPVTGSLQIQSEHDSAAANTERCEMGWLVQAARMVSPVWSPMEARRDLSGETVEEAARILQNRYTLRGSPQVRLWPAWWPWMPFAPFRIEVISR